ncbi:hypothetical protein C8T65DRAFT_90139 [Cerioporus squamosus]|nr:hypothetical protein C8T65DRAFT_90139 [Cerioporus squamosus]
MVAAVVCLALTLRGRWTGCRTRMSRSSRLIVMGECTRAVHAGKFVQRAAGAFPSVTDNILIRLCGWTMSTERPHTFLCAPVRRPKLYQARYLKVEVVSAWVPLVVGSSCRTDSPGSLILASSRKKGHTWKHHTRMGWPTGMALASLCGWPSSIWEYQCLRIP